VGTYDPPTCDGKEVYDDDITIANGGDDNMFVDKDRRQTTGHNKASRETRETTQNGIYACVGVCRSWSLRSERPLRVAGNGTQRPFTGKTAGLKASQT